jgi:hypothetical protein
MHVLSEEGHAHQKKCDGNCDGHPDIGANTGFIDSFGLFRISNLGVINTGQVHPAYRLVRHLLFAH